MNWFWLYDQEKNDWYAAQDPTIRAKEINGRLEVYGGGGCFVEGTLIATPNGPVSIENLKVGDEVLCFNDKGTICGSSIEQIYYHPANTFVGDILKVTFEGGELLVTDNHFIYDTDNRFKTMNMFKVGDTLTNINNQKVKILSIEKTNISAPVYSFTVLGYPTYIANEIRVHNGGGKKGGSETTVDYHWAFSISEIIAFEKPLIKFEATLGNVIMIGDGVATTTQIPNYYMRKYFHSQGYGYLKLYPNSIRLYRNSITNELIEDTDFTYNNLTGEITFLFIPGIGDIIAGTWTYDTEYPKETTFYADFSYNFLWKRVGFKYFKQEDKGLDTYLKCAIRAKHLLSEIFKPVVHGSYDIVYNPKINLGNSIYINHILPNVQRVFFIDSIRESHSKNQHTVEVGGLSFPEFTGEITTWKEQEGINRMTLNLPADIITFKGNTSRKDIIYISGKVKQLDSELLDESFLTNLQFKVEKRDESLIFPIIGSPFDPNTRYIRSYLGYYYQLYDISFQSGTYDEFSNPDVFWAQRLTYFTVLNSENSYEFKTNSSIVYVGRKELLNILNTPGIFAGNDHIIFIDIDGDIWMADSRFATKKLGSLESGDISSSQINFISSYQYIFVLFDNTLKRFDLDTSSWSTIGTLTYNYNHKYIPRGYFIDPEGYIYIFATGKTQANGGNWDNLLYTLKFKDNGIIEENIINEINVSNILDGNPLIGLSSGWIYFGTKAWDIYSKDYKASITNLESGLPTVYLKQNTTDTTIYATICYDNEYGINSTIGKSNIWSFHKRSDNPTNAWDKIGKITFSNSMIIKQLGIVGDSIVLYLKGEDLKPLLHPQTDSAIALLNQSTNKLEIKLAKVGEDIEIYNQSFYIGNNLYIDWKLYNLFDLPTLGEFNIS